MAQSSLFYYSPDVADSALRKTTFRLDFTTPAPTLILVPHSNAMLQASGDLGLHPTQAEIDAFLGTTNEFLEAQFAVTPLPTEWHGLIIDMQGQAKDVHGLEFQATNGASMDVRAIGHKVTSLTLLYHQEVT